MQQDGRLKSKSTSRKLSAALLAAFIMLIAYSGVVFAQTVIVQTYFVPVDEDDALDSLRSINTASVAPVQSYISIAIGSTGTRLFYDHWEDGFLPNFTTDGLKGSGGTTEIWGDGICSNGYPPNKNGANAPGTCTPAWDSLAGGDVIVPQNPIGTANATEITQAQRDAIDFDGGDMIASTEQIAVSRVYWSSVSNTLSAAALELYPTNEWGLVYRAPVGETTTGANNSFGYTSVSIQASANGTVVMVDHDNNSSTNPVRCPATGTMAQGESCVVNDIIQGATITSNADHPVQVQMLTGIPGSNYAYSGYTLLPENAYSNNYYAPVSRVSSSYPVRIFLFNPATSGGDLLVRCEFASGTAQDRSIPPGGVVNVDVPNDSTGERCFTRDSSGTYNPSGGNFFAIVTHDTGLTYDWGLTMMPASKLDKQVLIGIGLGKDPTASGTENGSPIWVTPIANACLFVDANGDGVMDNITNTTGSSGYAVPRYLITNKSGAHAAGIVASTLSSSRFFHEDGNQTGMQIFSRELVGGVCPAFDGSLPGPDIVAAWGEDPGKASGGVPGFDVGVTNPNLRAFSVAKFHVLADGGLTAQPNDTITYTVRLRNTGFGTIANVIMKDALPAEVNNAASVVKLTRYNSANVAGATYTLTASEKTDFFGPGFAFNVASKLGGTNLEKGGYIDAVFAVTVNGTQGELACASFFVNKITITADGKPQDASTSTPCGYPLTIVKKIIGPAGEEFEFDPNTNLNGGTNFFLEPTSDNGSAEKVFPNLEAGKTYAAQEINVPANWNLDSIECKSSIPAGFSPTISATGFSLNLRPNGELITCTFTNSIQPKLRINIDGNATNAVGRDHTHKAVVESSIDGGVSWQKVNDATVNWALTGAAAATPSCNTGTDNQGDCDITFVSSTAGVTGISAKTTVTLWGKSLTAETGVQPNMTNGGSNVATKTWVDLRIKVSPLTDDNAVGQSHTFTALVEEKIGDGDWVAVENGVTVEWNVSPIPSTPGAATCLTAGGTGQCSITISSTEAKTFTASAKVTHAHVSGQPLTRETGVQPNMSLGGSNVAAKRYVDLRIKVSPLTDDNAVNQSHTFTALVEEKIGDGNWVAVENGVTVEWTVSPEPSTPGAATCATAGGTGQCSITISSDEAKTFTASAKVTHAHVSGQPLTRETGVQPNMTLGGSNVAIKNYVDLRIKVSPLTDNNALNDQHIFTALVEEKIGDGNWVPVENGVTVEWTKTPPPSTPGAATCATAGGTGQCSITINSNAPGTFVVNAKVTHAHVAGQPLTRDTAADSGPGGSGPATKKYVAALISITESATNAVGQPHTFTVKVEKHDGTGWSDASGVAVTPALVAGGVGTITGGTCTTGNTNASGECTVIVNSAVPGQTTVNASATVPVGSNPVVQVPVTTNGTSGSSGPVVKTWVDLSIKIDPATDTNPLNQSHTFTVTVLQNQGGATPTWSGLAGAKPEVTIAPATGWTLVNETCSAGTNASGVCTYTINSAGPNVYTAHAKVTASVSGQSMTRDTDPATADGAGPEGTNRGAVKRYVTARISITQSATNVVNDPHTFTVKVEKDDGTGWSNASGVAVTPSLVAGGVGSITGGTCTTGNTNASGECTVIVNSFAPGQTTVNASATVPVGSNPVVQVPVTTNGTSGSSGPVVKTWVDLSIKIDPATDTNPLSQSHTFTVTVLQNMGGATPTWSGLAGAKPEVTVTPTGWTLVNETCSAGTNASGVCTYTINSAGPNVYTAHAKVTASVNGQSMTRDTDPATADGAGPEGTNRGAVKRYVTARISITQSATNVVNDPHTFTVKVEKDDGTGWSNASGVAVTPALVAGSVGTITGGTCTTGNTNASGECTVIVNSAVPGQTTVNASATVAVGTNPVVQVPVATAVAGGGSGPVVKTWVDARIKIEGTATNPLNDPHTFTITAEMNLGSPDLWVPVPNGTKPVVTILPTGFTLHGSGDTCATAGTVNGVCTVTINSATAAVYTANAKLVNLDVAGETVVERNAPVPAIKTYVSSDLIVSKTVVPSWTLEYRWDVTKTVDGPKHLFDGEEDEFNWSIVATKSISASYDYKVTGVITIRNNGNLPVTLSKITDTVTGGASPIVSVVNLASCSSTTVAANGGTATCAYGPINATGAANLNTAAVEITTGEVASGNSPIAWGDPTSKVNDTVDLVDSNGKTTTTSQSIVTPWTYTTALNCSNPEGFTMTGFDQTGKSTGFLHNVVKVHPTTTTTIVLDESEATGYLTCYKLQTNKTADTSMVHTWDWNITKDVSTNSVDLTYPITQEITYEIEVTRVEPPTPSDWKVFGNITVVNPAPMAALVKIEDVLKDNNVQFGSGDPLSCVVGAAPATPNGNGEYTVPANGTLVCSYNENVPQSNWQSNALNNTALITQTIDGGSMRYDASDGFTFNPPTTLIPVNENSVDVTDVMTNSLGGAPATQQWVFTNGHTETYTHNACEGVDYGSGSTVIYTLENKATIIQNGKFDEEDVSIKCTRPDVVVVAKQFHGAYTEEYTWEITKTVEPETVDMFDGETRVLTWTITTERSAPLFTGTQSWDISIFNGSDRAVTVAEVDDSLGTPDCQTPFVVASGATRNCTLTGTPFTDVTALPQDWLNNSVTITTTNGYTSTASVTGSWAGKGTIINGSANITDTNKSEVWNGNDVITVPIEYTEDVTCESTGVNWSGDWNAGARYGVRNNTAEVWTPGTPNVTHDSDDASAAINCYRLGIGKTADPYFTRTYKWDIVKKADPISVSLLDGEQAVITWTVALTRDQGTESGFGADGVITVYNPAPMPANGVAIADLLPGVTLNCSTLNVPAASGQDLGTSTCPYTATLNSGDTVTNTATATFHNKVVTATATVDFTNAPVTIVDPTVNVTDTNVLTTTTVPWVFTGTRTETYTETVDCADVTYVNGVAQYSIPNTAQIIETGQDSSANVDVFCTALASVGDRVWRDLYPDGPTAIEQWLGDGLQNWELEPNVEGIEVQLWKPGPNGTVDGTLLMTTTTDINGEYLFDRLQPGEYYIVFVNRSGYPALFSTMVKQGVDRTIDSDGAPSMGTGVNAGFPVAVTDIFTLAPGHHDPTWDQALVATRGIGSAELGDRIWWDANKNGIQDTGELGVDKVKVELFKVDTADAPVGSGVLVDDTLTDANGNYLFTGLDGGFYYVKFTLPSGVVVTERFKGSDRGVDSNIDELGFSEVVNLREAESNLTIDAGIFVAPTADPDDPNGEPNVGDFTNMLWLPTISNR